MRKVTPEISKNTRTFHLANLATCVLKVTDDDFRMGFSFLSKNDRFCRKIGRAVAMGRCFSNKENPHLFVMSRLNTTQEQFVSEVAEHLYIEIMVRLHETNFSVARTRELSKTIVTDFVDSLKHQLNILLGKMETESISTSGYTEHTTAFNTQQTE